MRHYNYTGIIIMNSYKGEIALNIKLVVTDMDGTFLDDSSTFDKQGFQELKNGLAAQRIRFVFCTGKQCERVENIVGNWFCCKVKNIANH